MIYIDLENFKKIASQVKGLKWSERLLLIFILFLTSGTMSAIMQPFIQQYLSKDEDPVTVRALHPQDHAIPVKANSTDTLAVEVYNNGESPVKIEKIKIYGYWDYYKPEKEDDDFIGQVPNLSNADFTNIIDLKDKVYREKILEGGEKDTYLADFYTPINTGKAGGYVVIVTSSDRVRDDFELKAIYQ